ncbi:VirK family protein [Dickeya chrysanthemi]|uniref:VirK family protein n=1 Tax=Dickeya chrysanthemi TaxID=556 RepID=A0ABU8JGJ5_DICCH|nr:VirK family protein [Dickeya chrysanthemi]MBX9444769.1 VirK family protein [Dickeya chrysanthemi]
MSRITPVLLSAALLATTAPAMAAKSLKSADDVITALNQGRSVNVTIDLSACTPQEGTPASKTRGGLQISAYRLVDNGTLSFSDAHFTVANDGTPIQQFMRYQVQPDNTVRFTTFMFNLPSLQQRGNTLSYQCKLGQDIGFFVQ